MSQSVTAAGPLCEMLHLDTQMFVSNGQSMMAIDGMSHSHSAPATSDDSAPSDCCKGQACPMLNCVSLPAMAVSAHLQATANASPALLVNYTAAYTGTAFGSLYRPPISR